MAPSPGGVRSPDDAPRPPIGMTAGPSALAGMAGEDTTPSPDQGPGTMQQQGVQQLRQTQMMLTELSRRFPVAATSLNQANINITAALRQIDTNPGQPEPPAPNIGG